MKTEVVCEPAGKNGVPLGMPFFLMGAHALIVQGCVGGMRKTWIPAFAGMTLVEGDS